MSQKAKGRKGSARKKRVLVFGEDPNDTLAIKRLIEGLRPDLRGKVEQRREVFLMRKTTAGKLKRQAQKMREIVERESRAFDVVAVVKHEDCDAVEPAHVDLAARLDNALASLGCALVPCTPAWEMEAWFFLFPDACAAVRPGWRRPDDYLGRHVGAIRDAKEELRRKLRPKAKSKQRRVPDYEEADAPDIAEKIVSLELFGEPARTGTRSDSFEAFRSAVNALPR